MLAARTAFLGHGKHLVWRKGQKIKFKRCHLLSVLLVINFMDITRKLRKAKRHGEKYRKGENCFGNEKTKTEMQKNLYKFP
jgi:hypothetical protein